MRAAAVMVEDWPDVERKGFLARLFCQHEMRCVLFYDRFPGIRVRVCVRCGHRSLDNGGFPPKRTPSQPRGRNT
jgi:hypothetical protein